jgi:membrane-associated phospholipid phosphatase
LHWIKVNKTLGIILSIWTALIVASTLFVKQHYIADMLFGLALAFTFAWLYNKLIVRKPAAA